MINYNRKPMILSSTHRRKSYPIYSHLITILISLTISPCHLRTLPFQVIDPAADPRNVPPSGMPGLPEIDPTVVTIPEIVPTVVMTPETTLDVQQTPWIDPAAVTNPRNVGPAINSRRTTPGVTSSRTTEAGKDWATARSNDRTTITTDRMTTVDLTT